MFSYFFFFNDTATTEIYTLSYTTLFRSPAYLRIFHLYVGRVSPFRFNSKSVVPSPRAMCGRSEEHTSELQSQSNLVCRLLLEKKKMTIYLNILYYTHIHIQLLTYM